MSTLILAELFCAFHEDQSIYRQTHRSG